MVLKKNTDDDIVKFCKLVADAGIKSLDWYMIYGLPTENEEDIRLFAKLLKKVDSVMPSGYVIAIHWNAFTPSSMTPLQWARPAWNYKYIEEMDRLIFSLEQKNIRLMHKPRLTGNTTILRRMLAIRGSEANRDLIYTMSQRPGKFKSEQAGILKKYKDDTGVDLMGEWPIEHPLPWDMYVEYDKRRMLRLYKKKIQDAS